MKDEAIYVVRFWTRPDGGERVLQWLYDTHLADVLSQPGFLWVRMIELDEKDEYGWQAYQMIYGLRSLAALQEYFHGEAPKRYARERTELGLDDLFRAERAHGKVLRILAADNTEAIGS